MRRFISAVALAIVAVGCASHTAARETAVKGSLALSSFPSAPTAVVAKAQSGTEIRAAATASGDFSFSLPKGERYALLVELADHRVPIAMARRSGKLDASFKVSSDGALVPLGAVRYLPAGAKAIHTAAAAGQCTNGDGACVDDSEQTACESGQGGSGPQDEGQANDSTNDGECENGVDVTTKAPCTDPGGDDAEQVDAQGELAIPEHSAPIDASGCDDGEDPND